MKTRHEIAEMLTAAFSKSRLCGRFDMRIIVEEIADQLMVINDKHCRQIALAKAMVDARIDAMKREMASAKLDFNKVLRGLSLGLQGGLSESSDAIDQFTSQLADTHAEYATKLAQAKEEFDREIAALRQEQIHAYLVLAMLRAIDMVNGSGRGPNDLLN
jgi:predicted secreted Zn-dependent protease